MRSVSANNDTKVDGNAAGNTSSHVVFVTGITWANGANLVLRWTDANDTNNDDGDDLDDLPFSLNAPAPVAVADSFTATTGVPAVLGVLTNDSPRGPSP